MKARTHIAAVCALACVMLCGCARRAARERWSADSVAVTHMDTRTETRAESAERSGSERDSVTERVTTFVVVDSAGKVKTAWEYRDRRTFSSRSEKSGGSRAESAGRTQTDSAARVTVEEKAESRSGGSGVSKLNFVASVVSLACAALLVLWFYVKTRK